tara:strand:- start:1212 stop:1889 length:678 start_codon:yes stop_codon:yes gene_type:complete
MNKYIVSPITRSLKILGTEALLPIGKIYCVGKNYYDHIKEMNDSNENELPFFFSKPPQSLTQDALIKYPNDTHNLHHEVELVVYISNKCDDIEPKNAEKYILGYSVGIDLTKRDKQNIAKEKRQPWDLSKGFDNSAPVSEIYLCSKLIKSGKIELRLNGKQRQISDISKMIWPIQEIISNLSKQITLYPGDAIFTGTPAGVGSIEPKDNIEASIDGIGSLNISFQ